MESDRGFMQKPPAYVLGLAKPTQSPAQSALPAKRGSELIPALPAGEGDVRLIPSTRRRGLGSVCLCHIPSALLAALLK